MKRKLKTKNCDHFGAKVFATVGLPNKEPEVLFLGCESCKHNIVAKIELIAPKK